MSEIPTFLTNSLSLCAITSKKKPDHSFGRGIQTEFLFEYHKLLN